jgi:hypothetical protein
LIITLKQGERIKNEPEQKDNEKDKFFVEESISTELDDSNELKVVYMINKRTVRDVQSLYFQLLSTGTSTPCI